MFKSACNCCDEFPTDVVAQEARSTSGELRPCDWSWFIADEEGCATEGPRFYNQRVITRENDAGSVFVIGDESGIPVPNSDPEVDETQVYTFNPETCECDYAESGLRPEGSDTILSITYSNEYTDKMLSENIDGCLAELGEWGFGDASSEFYYISGLINDCAPWKILVKKNSELRITHPPTASGYLKVWLWRIVWTYNNSTKQWEDLEKTVETYEWSGTPPSLEHGINEPENKIISEVYTLEAEENTRVDLYVAKWSLLDGYEPDDPTMDVEYFEGETDYDGFGDPSLPSIVLTLTRPTPDCLSNGVPTLSEECPKTPLA